MIEPSLIILPGVAVGKFFIGEPISELLKKQVFPDKENPLIFRDSESAVKCYINEMISLCYLITTETERGITIDGIRCGMSVPEALKKDPTLYLDEIYESLYSRKYEGIGYILNVDDPLPNELPSLHIQAIEVFDPELVKLTEGLLKEQDIEEFRNTALLRWRNNLRQVCGEPYTANAKIGG